MATSDLLTFRLGEIVCASAIPCLADEDFRKKMVARMEDGARVVSFFAYPDVAQSGVKILAVFAFDAEGQLGVFSTEVRGQYTALTNECPQVHMFEREIAEQWGIRPVGHPDLRPLRFHRPYASGRNVFNESQAPGVCEYYQVKGTEVHEVAVGPVHAGIIEPGHFRFQCHGEDVFYLAVSLGYQHRGVEPALVGGANKRTPHYMETLAGDTTIGHALAYCQIFETLGNVTVSVRQQMLRAIALELERLANHTGDLGALANDVAFLPTASYCGRIRGDFLNMTALLCGNRFGRSFVCPGGTVFDVDGEIILELKNRLDLAQQDLSVAVELMLNNPSCLERFEGTGVVAATAVDMLGLVGPVARACGKERDVRVDFPTGIYRMTQIPISTFGTGDVFARACVRWLEVQRSIEFIQQLMAILPAGENSPVPPALPADSLAVGMIEGWRGEIAHVAITDRDGRFSRYKIVDPSFHNWPALGWALANEQISNFPLCNKSFNLSYGGVDL